MSDMTHLLDARFDTDLAYARGGRIEIDIEAETFRIATEPVSPGDQTYPAREFFGIERVYSLPAGTSVASLEADLADGGKLGELLVRIAEGGSVERNTNGNECGDLDDDARDAEEKLHELLDGYEGGSGLVVWDAGDWLRDVSDEQIMELAGLTSSGEGAIRTGAQTVVKAALQEDVILDLDDTEQVLATVHERFFEKEEAEAA